MLEICWSSLCLLIALVSISWSMCKSLQVSMPRSEASLKLCWSHQVVSMFIIWWRLLSDLFFALSDIIMNSIFIQFYLLPADYSQLLSRRPEDDSSVGFKNWIFNTVHFWGTPSSGEYKVNIGYAVKLLSYPTNPFLKLSSFLRLEKRAQGKKNAPKEL